MTQIIKVYQLVFRNEIHVWSQEVLKAYSLDIDKLKAYALQDAVGWRDAISEMEISASYKNQLALVYEEAETMFWAQGEDGRWWSRCGQSKDDAAGYMISEVKLI